MVLVAQMCEPKCTEVSVVTTDQLIHSLEAFANKHQPHMGLLQLS